MPRLPSLATPSRAVLRRALPYLACLAMPCLTKPRRAPPNHACLALPYLRVGALDYTIPMNASTSLSEYAM